MVYPIFPPSPRESSNGITQMIHGLGKALVRRGHHVEVFAADALDIQNQIPRDLTQTEIDGIVVNYFHSIGNFRTYFVTPSITEGFKRQLQNFELVHVHDFRTFQGSLAGHYAHRAGIPYVLQTHGGLARNERKTIRSLFDIMFGRSLISKSYNLVALTPSEAAQYHEFGVERTRISVIPNGIDVSKYASLPTRGNFKKKWRLAYNSKVILFLGRIHWVKGLDFLIEAVEVLKRNSRDDFILVIAGPNDGYLQKVLEFRAKYCLNDRMLVVGPLYGMSKLEAFVDADFIVCPSRYETFPVSVLEAYACSKPVLASDTGGLRDLVVNRHTGMLVEFGDTKALADTLNFMLQNPDITTKMGKEGKTMLQERFSMERVTDLFEHLYNKCVAKEKDIH